MPLKVKTVKGVVTLSWSTPTMEASWKITPSMTEAEVMDTLCRVVIFVNSQNREPGKMEYELIQPQAAMPSPAPVGGTGISTTSDATATGRILMPPPNTVGDRPSDGGVPQGNIDFASLPTTTVPAELQKSWEIMPPEEMTW